MSKQFAVAAEIATIASRALLPSAQALPTAPPLMMLEQSATSDLIRVQERRTINRDGDMRRDGDRQRYTPGRRYRNAPPSWNRYGGRAISACVGASWSGRSGSARDPARQYKTGLRHREIARCLYAFGQTDLKQTTEPAGALVTIKDKTDKKFGCFYFGMK